jgi:hypothetical protein
VIAARVSCDTQVGPCQSLRPYRSFCQLIRPGSGSSRAATCSFSAIASQATGRNDWQDASSTGARANLDGKPARDVSPLNKARAGQRGGPGQPISPSRMAERLRQLGIHPGQARSTALFQLATDLPAALLARMLGIHIKVAVAWQHASAGDWTSYAADVSRRRQPVPHGHSDSSDI